jgi:hypothetical protein
MKELYFTDPNSKTNRALRLEYGHLGGKYVLKTFEGGENPNGLFLHKFIYPRKEVFDNEQGLLKKLYETKSGLLEGCLVVQNKQSISQLSSISTNVIDGEFSVELIIKD